MDIETLFNTYHDEIYAFLWRNTLDGPLAQDLAADTFLKALRHLPTLAPDSNFRAWLYRVASNALHDHWRAAKRLSDAPLDWLDSGEHIERDYARRELLAAVAQEVMALPEKQRLALIMARYQDLSYAEIAEALACSEDAARANVYQATRKLRQIFTETEA